MRVSEGSKGRGAQQRQRAKERGGRRRRPPHLQNDLDAGLLSCREDSVCGTGFWGRVSSRQLIHADRLK
jgi:hypothetical protein